MTGTVCSEMFAQIYQTTWCHLKMETTGSFQTFETTYQKGHYHIAEDHSFRCFDTGATTDSREF
jgi:hypothetical protein